MTGDKHNTAGDRRAPAGNGCNPFVNDCKCPDNKRSPANNKCNVAADDGRKKKEFNFMFSILIKFGAKTAFLFK